MILDSKRQALVKKYGLEAEQITEMSKLDPTKNGAYTDWLCRESRTGLLDPAIRETLSQFDRVKRSPQFAGKTNIFDWNAPDLTAQFQKKWRERREGMSKRDIRAKLVGEGLPGARLIMDSGPWKIWRVVKPEYAVILGSKTSWCTAQLETANSYCSQGPLYPIWKGGKPWAQGHVGLRGVTLLNAHNHHVTLCEEAFDLIERAKGVPQIQVLFETCGGSGEGVEQFIRDTDNSRLLQAYLQSVFWEEGWELILDVGDPATITHILRGMEPSARAGFSASPIFLEILGMPEIPLPENMLTELIGMGRVEEYLKSSKQVELGGLRKEQAVAVRKYLADLTAPTDLIHKIEFEKTDYKRIVLPYWKKFFESKPLPYALHSEMMQHVPEYAKVFKDKKTLGVQAVIPGVRQNDRITFELLSQQGVFGYRHHGSFLAYNHETVGYSGGSNRAIFDALKLHAVEFLTQAYGYPADHGDWPTSRDGDVMAMTRAVNALRPYCKSIKVNDKVYE